MALSAIVQSVNDGYSFVVDVDLKSYFDTISHELLLRVGGTPGRRRSSLTPDPSLVEGGSYGGRQGDSPGSRFSSGRSDFADAVQHLSARGRSSMVPERRSRSRQRSAGPLCGRYGAAGANGTTRRGRRGSNCRAQFAALRLVVNQEKSRLTTLAEGFAFLGFEFRKAPGRMLLMWPREKACRNIRQRVREVVRSFPSNGQVGVVIQKLNPILNGWCTYFRVGNSNRTFHKVDWAVRSELQLWLRRKHQCRWRTAKKRWGYHFLHDRCRLYQMVGKVSHLEGLRRKPPDEDDRRAGCGKSARPVR